MLWLVSYNVQAQALYIYLLAAIAATSLPAIERLISACLGSYDNPVLLLASSSGGGELGRGGGGPETSEIAESGLSLNENCT